MEFVRDPAMRPSLGTRSHHELTELAKDLYAMVDELRAENTRLDRELATYVCATEENRKRYEQEHPAPPAPTEQDLVNAEHHRLWEQSGVPKEFWDRPGLPVTPFDFTGWYDVGHGVPRKNPACGETIPT